MKFWDSSSLVALVIEEERSGSCRDLARADRDIVAWTFATLEGWGAVCRKRREGLLDEAGLAEADRRLERRARSWRPILDSADLRSHARRLLRSHELRSEVEQECSTSERGSGSSRAASGSPGGLRRPGTERSRFFLRRSADALQLAAALVWCDGRPRDREFVAGYARLLGAAGIEGFTTIRPA